MSSKPNYERNDSREKMEWLTACGVDRLLATLVTDLLNDRPPEADLRQYIARWALRKEGDGDGTPSTGTISSSRRDAADTTNVKLSSPKKTTAVEIESNSAGMVSKPSSTSGRAVTAESHDDDEDQQDRPSPSELAAQFPDPLRCGLQPRSLRAVGEGNYGYVLRGATLLEEIEDGTSPTTRHPSPPPYAIKVVPIRAFWSLDEAHRTAEISDAAKFWSSKATSNNSTFGDRHGDAARRDSVRIVEGDAALSVGAHHVLRLSGPIAYDADTDALWIPLNWAPVTLEKCVRMRRLARKQCLSQCQQQQPDDIQRQQQPSTLRTSEATPAGAGRNDPSSPLSSGNGTPPRVVLTAAECEARNALLPPVVSSNAPVNPRGKTTHSPPQLSPSSMLPPLFSIKELQHVLKQLLLGLHFLSVGCHMVHLDIKPSNILFEEPWWPSMPTTHDDTNAREVARRRILRIGDEDDDDEGDADLSDDNDEDAMSTDNQLEDSSMSISDEYSSAAPSCADGDQSYNNSSSRRIVGGSGGKASSPIRPNRRAWSAPPNLYIGDYGLVQKIGDPILQLGDFLYMPPEVYWAKQSASEDAREESTSKRANVFHATHDTWSVGIVLLYMLEGEVPFTWSDKDLFSCLEENYVVPMVKNTSQWPPEVLSFLLQCFERDYDKRPTAMTLLRHPLFAL